MEVRGGGEVDSDGGEGGLRFGQRERECNEGEAEGSCGYGGRRMGGTSSIVSDREGGIPVMVLSRKGRRVWGASQKDLSCFIEPHKVGTCLQLKKGLNIGNFSPLAIMIAVVM